MEKFCFIYKAWVSSWQQNGGPKPTEAVAWHLVISHGKNCSSCRDSVTFLEGRIADRNDEVSSSLNCSVGSSWRTAA
jgi:hypothetical protein